MKSKHTKQAVDILNHILEMELAGAIHYTHYSFMVYGYNRIPIVKWLEEQADESIAHARATGELVTQLGAHPSVEIWLQDISAHRPQKRTSQCFWRSGRLSR